MSASVPAKRVLGSRFVSMPRPLLLLQQDADPGEDLFDVDRLGQVLVDAELEAADLVLDRRLRR